MISDLYFPSGSADTVRHVQIHYCIIRISVVLVQRVARQKINCAAYTTLEFLSVSLILVGKIWIENTSF
jgi:hypothetical protein